MSRSPSNLPDLEAFLTLRNFLFALSVVVFLIAWNRGITLLYGMLAMLLAVLLVSYLAPAWMLRGLNLQHRHPPRINEGESFAVALSVTHSGRLARSMVEVWGEFSAAPEHDRQHMSFLPLVKKRSQTALTFNADYRGLHKVGPFTLKSAFPLGMHTVQRQLADASEILVLPQTFPVGFFPYTSGDYMPLRGVNAVSMAGGSDLFFGVREYRHGDNPRHIHWPSSARHNALIVKEFQYVTATELTILLDLHGQANHGEGKHSTLEYAIKIAASVAEHALHQGHHVRLMGFGAQALDMPVHSAEHQLPSLLDALARVRSDGTLSYEQAINQAMNTVRQGSVVLAFAVPPPGKRPSITLTPFAGKHVKPVWVQMHSDSFLHPVQRQKGGLTWAAGNMPVYSVYCHDDLAGVFSRT